MEKIKSILSEIFSASSLLSGIIGISIGFLGNMLLQTVTTGSFEKILIFIATGTVLILCVLVLGFIMNKTIFKDDL